PRGYRGRVTTAAAHGDVARAPSRVGAAPSAGAMGLVLAVVTVLFGLGPPVTKLISAPPLIGASLRLCTAVPILWLLARAAGHRVSRQVLRRSALAGVFLGANQAMVFAALQHASVAV